MALVSNLPKSKVELHIHLDGAVRPSTIYELAQKKGIDLGVKSADELKQLIYIAVDSPVCLTRFLQKFAIFTPVLIGDQEAVERISYELCEDSARDNIVYSEVRLCPHLLSDTSEGRASKEGMATPREVVVQALRGFERGEKDFNVKMRLILTCMRHKPGRNIIKWSQEILDLCIEFKGQGVVGIDLAGDENMTEVDPTHVQHIAVFQEAAKLGIKRTVHAGENGTSANVLEAMDDMLCDRLGHGYHALDCKDVFGRIVQTQMHLEMCPISSIITGSVTADFEEHALQSMVANKASFSVSTDDPVITGSTLTDEYNFIISKYGLTPQDIMTANLHAAKAAFLPEAEKAALYANLCEEYGMKL
ncbi:hypothetical protein CAPTEDRAFT_228813 [Capitella teleta]|uniref:Adenosine deaminase n=1 Tax=Capitella teleta TaxID=283909 RepID=R7UYW8_CAPTE|nr:hypothetical protein CAPTEDRAFT_228813 [Capitella teleta]|eukprot:ELU09132.1 hypothetical protein CAPTEDRAFT_228813 [Capitella teleta]